MRSHRRRTSCSFTRTTSRRSACQAGLGLINPALYKLAANSATYAADFFDIAHTAVAGTANDNQGDPSVPGFPATPGWDPVTGLGTPNAAALIPDLVDAAHS
jgi:hypothetical protein